MENTKDQYIGAEIHSARSVNPDGETVTLDGDTVVWTGEEDVLTPEELAEEAKFLESIGLDEFTIMDCLVLKTAVTIAVVAAISFCYP